MSYAQTVSSFASRCLLGGLLALPLSLGAHAGAPPSASAVDPAVSAETDAEALSRFDVLYILSANHPNERYRLYGQKAAAMGHWGDAAKSFRMAARYADKYSQHRLSLLYWHGIGVREDRVQAYLWADIAAERGYPQFLAIRERMWRELSAAQQAAVTQRGPALYAEYGDPTAKPRFRAALAQGRAQVTGSRTGFAANVDVLPGEVLRGVIPNLNDVFLLARMHAPERNDPEKYWRQEDRAWKNGMVEVGELEPVDSDDERAAPPRP